MILLSVELLPQVVQEWSIEDSWQLSEMREYSDGGTRVGILLTAELSDAVWVEARTVDESGFTGPWLPAEETWRGGDSQRILVVDFGSWTPAAQVRLEGPVEELGWALHVVEPRSETPAVQPPAVSASLEAIGVIPREDWGADPTSCTKPEDDWYRFAIHHTAGNQTSSGTVQGAVQALQAYAQNSGTYCDIPYQFLVGYDGSLWEGRTLSLYSGATGGGNNDGNIAVSYLGCYDSGACDGGGDELPLVMHAGARLLAQTLADEHGISTTSDTLRGHRDWPGNATACPGDRIHGRLDELMSSAAHYEASFVESSWDGPLTLQVGEIASGWVRVRNEGILSWDESTRLAPMPRDSAHPLAASSWLSENRIASTGSVAPGQTVDIPVELYGSTEGSYTMELGLLQEWVTWFADPPIGGGPVDGSLSLEIQVVAESEETGEFGDSGDTAPPVGEAGPPGETRPLATGACGCAATSSPWGGLIALLMALLLKTRGR